MEDKAKIVNSDMVLKEVRPKLHIPKSITFFASILIGFIIMVGIIIYFYRSQTQASFANAEISILPRSLHKNINQEFFMTVTMNPRGNKITVVDAEVQFDKTKLQLTAIESGKYGFLPVILKKEIGDGSARIAFGALPNKQRKSSSVLVILKFKAMQQGVSEISFTENTKIISSDRNNENILGKMRKAKVSVN